jgi:glucose/arabinose dehydrogenase
MGGFSGIMLGISIAAVSAGAATAAVPVEKSGPCPPLTRHAADSKDNWDQAWQAKPKPADSFRVNTIQDNLTPAQSINCIEPSPGLKLQLWASEEMPGNMAYLQHFTFDERGRVWAVEPKNYPNTILPAAGNINDQKFTGGKDRIVILEDTDGDKVMDKFKVFRDGLNLPQSIEVVNGGVVVTMTPYVVFFPNQNDTAGTPVILFSGMGSSGTSWDTHAGINQLMYGLDNWIYGMALPAYQPRLRQDRVRGLGQRPGQCRRPGPDGGWADLPGGSHRNLAYESCSRAKGQGHGYPHAEPRVQRGREPV